MDHNRLGSGAVYDGHRFLYDCIEVCAEPDSIAQKTVHIALRDLLCTGHLLDQNRGIGEHGSSSPVYLSKHAQGSRSDVLIQSHVICHVE